MANAPKPIAAGLIAALIGICHPPCRLAAELATPLEYRGLIRRAAERASQMRATNDTQYVLNFLAEIQTSSEPRTDGQAAARRIFGVPSLRAGPPSRPPVWDRSADLLDASTLVISTNEWDRYLVDLVTTNRVFTKNAVLHLRGVRPGIEIIGGEPDNRGVILPIRNESDRIRQGMYADCVAVGDGRNWYCSGVLIASNKVLSAGHCCGSSGPTQIFIGTNTAFAQFGKIVSIANYEIVKGFKMYGEIPENDLVVFTLAQPVVVPLKGWANSAQISAAHSIRVVGFGSRDPVTASSALAGERYFVDIPIAEHYCNDQVSPIRNSQLCAVELDGRNKPVRTKDQCAGDSGGPAYVKAGNDWLLAGITSYRFTVLSGKTVIRECGAGGVYTRVDSYLTWLQKVR